MFNDDIVASLNSSGVIEVQSRCCSCSCWRGCCAPLNHPAALQRADRALLLPIGLNVFSKAGLFINSEKHRAIALL